MTVTALDAYALIQPQQRFGDESTVKAGFTNILWNGNLNARLGRNSQMHNSRISVKIQAWTRPKRQSKETLERLTRATRTVGYTVCSAAIMLIETAANTRYKTIIPRWASWIYGV